MRVEDVERLKNWLERRGALDGFNAELIEDAIYCVKNGSDYRAEGSLKTLARNLRNEGKSEDADEVERFL